MPLSQPVDAPVASAAEARANSASARSRPPGGAPGPGPAHDGGLREHRRDRRGEEGETGDHERRSRVVSIACAHFEKVHKVGTLRDETRGPKGCAWPYEREAPRDAGSRRRRSPACRSTTGPCSRPPSTRSARSRRSAWPSWPGSTRPRSARTSRTSGSYGTRGVGYDVEYLLHEISRELGLTRDWPVAIVGHRQPRPRPSRTTGASAHAASGSWRSSTPTRRIVGKQVGDLAVESIDDLRRIVARARDRDRHHRHAGARRPRKWPTASSRRACRSILNFAPAVVHGARAACRCARSTSRSSCRSCPSTNSRRGAAGARDRETAPGGSRRTASGRGGAAASPAPGSRAIPVNLLVARPPRASSSARAGSRPARSSRSSTLGADVARRRARGRRRGPGAGPTRAGARAASSAPFVPADLDGAWLAAHRHRRSRRSTRRCSRPARPGRVWVNSADDPANCSFTLMSVVRRGDLVVAIGTGGRSPALAAYLRRHARRGARTRVRDPARPALARPGKRCGPPGVPARTPIGNGPSIPASWTWSAPDASPKRRSCCARVSDRRRPEPPHRAGRAARAHDGARRRSSPKVLARPRGARAPARGRACSPRATAPRSTRAARTSTPRSATSATSSPTHSGADPDEFAEHLYTYYDDAAVAHLFSVAAGLDSMIVGEGEILGQVRDAWQAAGPRRQRRRQLLPRLFRHAIESGKRVRTETGDRPPSGVDPVGRGRGRGRAPRRPRRRAGPRDRRRPDGAAGSRRRLRVARRRRRVDREPHARPRRGARRASSAAEAIPLSDIADTLVDVDVLLTSTASSEVLVERVDGRDGDGVPRRPSAARSSTSRCRATSIPACARSTTSRCSTSTT